jgi:bacterioferritin-associated ferredoxin
LPIPGWTLPGVMTVGAAQIALKTAGLVPSGNTWMAGQGPLLLLYAVQALRAGGRFAGVLDLSDRRARWAALPHLPRASRAFSELRKGLLWWREINRAGVQWIRAGDLRAEGEGALSRIRFRADGRERTEPADLLLLHDGVIPSVQITRALGLAHGWDAAQRCWKPVTDEWGVSSLPNLLLAGDGAGVGGALAATCSGRLAALGAACALGRIDAATRDTAAVALRSAHARHLALRPFLDAFYAPHPPQLDDATLVCRCEEVTAGQIRAAAKIGALGLNQLKAFTRCGMGPCQGRMCGATAAEVMAAARGMPVEQIEPYRTRFPTKPLTLGELAALNQDA